MVLYMVVFDGLYFTFDWTFMYLGGLGTIPGIS